MFSPSPPTRALAPGSHTGLVCGVWFEVAPGTGLSPPSPPRTFQSAAVISGSVYYLYYSSLGVSGTGIPLGVAAEQGKAIPASESSQWKQKEQREVGGVGG